jgi:hypothetical protein
MHTSRIAVSVGTALLLAASAGVANASTIEASLFSPEAGSGPVVIDLTGITAPSQIPFSGIGYTVSFVGVASDQGVVKGALGGRYAIPVAGVSGGQPEYLTGAFGSAPTTIAGDSGNYFSTGTGKIVIGFTTPQTWLALLWGSIDTGNSLTFDDTANTVVTGLEVQTATTGFVSNGYQGPGGSAYVLIKTDTPFTSVTATSDVVSFEFGGVAGSNSGFTTVPEPGSFWCLFGIGAGIVAMRRRINFR